MSAIVCGKRSFFEDLSSPPVTKRIRFSSSSSSSPVRFSPTRSTTSPFSASAQPSQSSSLLDHLLDIFPDMDKQLLEKALDESGDDLDSAIKSLNELRLGSNAGQFHVAPESNDQFQPQGVMLNGEVASTEDISAPKNHHMDGGEWVELFVQEMMSASDMDDARARASRALESLEKSIIERAGLEAAQSLHQENMMLKEQVETLIQENTLLKRAVSIQHERQREHEDRAQEVQNLKQMVSQYQEQLRTLEVNNYALTMHLRQAQQSNSIPGRFHPDVF